MTDPIPSLPEGPADGVTSHRRVRVTFEGYLTKTEGGLFDQVKLHFDDGTPGDTIAPYLLRYAKIEPIADGDV